MSKQRSIHLFNCDHTYKLDAVEDWLKATKPNLESVEQHYFPLAKMSDMSNETIPGLQMDLAVFVVHAHESCLFINEPNAGIGYAKIYKALLQATENVIIVIGGDDNYKDEDEEDKEFISRWAKRRVSSQFSEEYQDGRKSFIFSWNQKHRDIHEEALRHFFDSRKKGQKFEYQPKRRLPPKPLTPPLSSAAADTVPPSERQSSLPKSRSVEDKFSDMRCYASPGPRDQESKSKEERSSTTEKTMGRKDIAIFGCKVSEESMQSVLRVFGDIRLKLNLSENPQVENWSPAKVKRYLEENLFRFCVLVVDAEVVKDVYDNLPERKIEYEELLKTAVDRVAEKVIIFVCNYCSLPPDDATIVHDYIERVFKKSGKGFVAWLTNGKLAIEPDVLAQFLNSQKTSVQMVPQRSCPVESFPEQPSVLSGFAHGSQQHYLAQTSGQHLTQPLEGNTTYGLQGPLPHQPRVTVYQTSKGEPIMFKSKLRLGSISYHPDDIITQRPGFKVPYYIAESLLKLYHDTYEAEVEIVSDPADSKVFRWSVEPKEKENRKQKERLLFKSRVRDGLISYDPNDVKHCSDPEWRVPPYIADSLKREKSSGTLSVFSDEEKNVFYKVEHGITDTATEFIKEKTAGWFKNHSKTKK